tara:strand:+ start:17354 stop:18367 length:1014 start_codon:yes stop_codon:yes gene_type:complete
MIIVRTPLRVTFAGGGSDIPSYFYQHDGSCINATIDKYVYVLVKKRSDNKVYLKYSENEVVDVENITNIKHDFIRETLLYLGINYGIEIINWADIPTKGSGLGSSGSFLVGLLHAIHTLQGDDVSKEILAKEASYIEMIKCFKPIGYQDQYAASYGGVNQFYFSTTQDYQHVVKVKSFNLSDKYLRLISDNLLLFYTGITRESKDILEDQNKEMTENINVVELMKKNVSLSHELSNAIKNDRFDFIGDALNTNWELKSQFSDKILNEKIKLMYYDGLKAGAQGGKLLGAGGGGYMMFYVEKNFHNRVVEKMSEYQMMPISIDKYGSRILLNTEDKVW